MIKFSIICVQRTSDTSYLDKSFRRNETDDKLSACRQSVRRVIQPRSSSLAMHRVIARVIAVHVTKIKKLGSYAIGFLFCNSHHEPSPSHHLVLHRQPGISHGVQNCWVLKAREG